jgi:CubicO group peptidase (beta-lactamase class C family)
MRAQRRLHGPAMNRGSAFDRLARLMERPRLPHHRSLLLLTLLPLIALGAPARGEVVKGPLGMSLDRLLTALEGYGYSGSALVAQHGEVILDKGYGLADRGRNLPFTADTLFDIASISKPFTAAAVLRMEMLGKLKVEDKLSKFFPDAPPDKAAITLHQLLTHTAGLPETIGPEDEVIDKKAFLKRIYATPLVHPPGAKFLYSNAGYSLLAAVVEKVTGKSFGDVLHEQVFMPAGMLHSGFIPSAQDLPRLAHGYTGDGDWGTSLTHPRAPDGPWWNLRGNGGILTTTGDLYRWSMALQGTAVLSAPEKVKYEEGYVRESKAVFPQYAYGWSFSKAINDHRKLSHVGGNSAFQSDYRRFPDDGAVIAIGSNTDGYSSIAIANHLEESLYGKPFVGPPPVVPASEAELRRCAGVYQLPSGERIEVAVGKNRLEVTPQSREGLEVVGGQPGAERYRRFAQREESVVRVMNLARRGNLKPLSNILVDHDEESNRWYRTLKALEAKLGPWKGISMIGTRSLGGQVITHALLTFQKGERILHVVWAGPTADHLAMGTSIWPNFFLPEGPSRFVTYEVGTEAIVHLTCEGSGGGPASALRFESARTTVTAQRRAGG